MKTVQCFALPFLGCLLLAGCKKRTSGSQENASTELKPMTPTAMAAKTDAPPKKPDPQAERQRRVKRELERYNPHRVQFDAAKLPAGEKKLLGKLLEAADLVERLNKLQVHPHNLRYEREVKTKGTPEDRALFARYQMAWCTDDESALCNAHPGLPKKAIGLHHWPQGMTDAEFKKLSSAKNAKELLSPFTVVRRVGTDQWKAVPYSRDPVFGPPMKALAAKLVEAAQLATEPSLKKFLLSRAKALTTHSAYPYDQSDYDWIALKGRFEVTVGPYEVYKNPRQVKARFQMVIGVEDPKLSADLARFRKHLQSMENGLARLVGPKIYRPRKLDPRIAVRAIRVIRSAGDARNPHGAIVAFHLPNRGKSVDEGLYKKVMLVNHSTAFRPIVKRRAALVLHPDQQRFVSTEADITNTTFHEFAHGFGAHDELKIRTPGGQQTTVHQALKEHTTLLEELKADVSSMWLIAQSLKRRWITEEQARVRYVSGLMHILGLSSYPLKGTYPRMVAVQLGWYMDHGGVGWDTQTGRFRVDFQKLPAAVESLTKRTATIQLTGDKAAADALIGRYVKSVGKGRYVYLGRIKVPLTRMKAAFKQANIKSVALSYHPSGL